MLEVPHGAFDLALCTLQLRATHQRCGARETTAGAVGDRQDHRQIPQQFFGWRWRLRGDLLMGFQEQFWRIQNPLPYGRRCVAPGRVQFTGLAAGETVPGKRIGHALAVVDIGARHRSQILHGDMRRDLAGTNALLHTVRQLFHQSQPARHPTHAAIEAPRQILQAIAETLFQFSKQPTLFERCFAFGKTHRPIQHQSVGFIDVPKNRFDRVPAELLQSGHPFESIDQPIATGLFGIADDHDRRLLSRCGNGGD